VFFFWFCCEEPDTNVEEAQNTELNEPCLPGTDADQSSSVDNSAVILPSSPGES